MKIKKTIEIKISQEELVDFMAKRVIELDDEEEYVLVSAYSGLGEYTFDIIDTEEDSDDECR